MTRLMIQMNKRGVIEVQSKPLNGAQTQSLLAIAVKLISTAIGITNA